MSTGKTKYYVLKEKAVPEVLLKVIEAKKLMETGNLTVQEATERAGISRSSFYKYKEDIFPFHPALFRTFARKCSGSRL